LYALLSKDIILKGRRKILKLDDKEVDFNDNFQLLLQTSKPNPNFLPETANFCNIVSFNSSEDALKDLFLGVIISAERPELEQSRNSLLQSIASYNASSKELENGNLGVNACIVREKIMYIKL
jgi:dynein heavy chain, axonemal